MKVLMLGWELPPHNSGGLGVASFNLCKALSRLSVDIEFVLPYHADHDINFMKILAATPQDVKAVIKSGIAYDSYKYLMVDGTEEFHNIFDQQFMYETAIGLLINSGPYDLIHAHDWLTFRAGLIAKEKLGCPLILHVHSLESDRAGGSYGNPMVHEIEELAFHEADRIIAVSNLTRQAIVRDYGIGIEKIDVIHNSIDLSDTVDAEYDLTNTYQYLAALRAQGYRIVTNVGRLTLQKGLTNLLKAAKVVIEHAPKTMFLIVGNGEQYYELLTIAADLGIAKNVIFTDFQRGKPWRDAFSIADLFVMPSVSEPFGLVPLEAIGYGTPTLITKQSGVGEVLMNTLRVDFWDIDEMANQIIAVVQNDPLRDELLKNASGELGGLSWDNAASKLMSVYQNYVTVAAA
ncbi:MAG: glycosyltransferase family 4 protein [Candidatus Saccharimonadales bacterium]